MKIEEFNEDTVRFIRTFGDVRSVHAEMVLENDTERWLICEPALGKYAVPPGITVGDALRMFPEFKNVI